jgi:hypothetical protein
MIGWNSEFTVRIGTALIVLMLAASAACAEDVNWSASVSLWRSLAPNGQLMDAGPAPDWASPPPAARLGSPIELLRPAPIGTPRPNPLPDDLLPFPKIYNGFLPGTFSAPAARLAIPTSLELRD